MPGTFRVAAFVGAWLAGCVVLVALGVYQGSWSPYVAVSAVLLTFATVAAYRRVSVGSILAGSRPRTPLAAVAGVVVAVALVAAVARVTHVVGSASDAVSGPHYSLTQADIQPLGVSASVEAIANAARTIPVGATYSLVGGDLYDASAAYRVWLAPRPFSFDYHTTQWVIVNGQPVPADLPPGTKIPL